MAPNFKHGRLAAVFMTSATGGTVNFSSGLDDSELARQVETAKTTTFGKADHTYIPGLIDKSFKVSGHMASTHAKKLDAMVAWSTGTTITYAPMSTVAGNRKYVGSAIMTDYTMKAGVADKVSVSLDFQGSGAWTSTNY